MFYKSRRSIGGGFTANVELHGMVKGLTYISHYTDFELYLIFTEPSTAITTKLPSKYVLEDRVMSIVYKRLAVKFCFNEIAPTVHDPMIEGRNPLQNIVR